MVPNQNDRMKKAPNCLKTAPLKLQSVHHRFHDGGGEPIYYHGPHELYNSAGRAKNQSIWS